VGLYRDLKKLGVTAQQIFDAIKRLDKNQPAPPKTGVVDRPVLGFVSTWVVVDAGSTGGGVYTGRYLIRGPQFADLDHTADLTESVAGTFGSAAIVRGNALSGFCYVFNFAEVDQTTHYLTTGTPNAKIFPALYLGHDKNDRVPCFGINGLDWYLCE
jgi:hypothetical protein